MNVSVIVPWRSRGCAHREAAWERVQEEWDAWDLFTADDGGEPFSRAASINQGVEAHPADVYVIADADVLVDSYQAQWAVEHAAIAPGLVVAFERWAHVTKKGSQQILDGFAGSWEPLIDFTWPSISACLALSHETWELTGGFDSRFRAWGMEDSAFEVACRTLAGPTRRVPGSVYHLWHPNEDERPAENVALLRRYEAADGKPEELRALMARV